MKWGKEVETWIKKVKERGERERRKCQGRGESMRRTQRKGERIMRRGKRQRKECVKRAVSGIVRKAVEVELCSNIMNSEEGRLFWGEVVTQSLQRAHHSYLLKGLLSSFSFLSHYFFLFPAPSSLNFYLFASFHLIPAPTEPHDLTGLLWTHSWHPTSLYCMLFFSTQLTHCTLKMEAVGFFKMFAPIFQTVLAYIMLVTCLAHSLALKMEAVRSFVQWQ